MEDILLSNQWLIITWVGVLLSILGANIISAVLARHEEATQVRKQLFSWVWCIFLIGSFIGMIGVGVSQSVNYMPRHPENRKPANQDQRNFENRINEEMNK